MVDFPDGLHSGHARPRSVLHRHASPISILLLASFLGLALFGWMGGRMPPPDRIDGPAAEMTISAPSIVRNGMFVEVTIDVLAKRDIADAVLAMEPELWRRQTQNSMVPADRVTRAEVESEMRQAGIASMEEVAWGILEPQGKFSFIRKSQDA
ncbi:DUF421 domain-containing protein [Aureimonas altamirensis]|uniref:YetF domain-containing protein n=1 Tax=Aureimonas altamirensis TaxID=370622 RepID=UPI001E65C1EE|nr:YetF domain-containing protein [Aureimonas altamirensis]UHD46270.1 DUF421 domain-containing protein [Aureimonas altamirensis]